MKKYDTLIKARLVLMGLIDSPYINFFKIYVKENEETKECNSGIGGSQLKLETKTYTYRLAIDYELNGVECTIYGEEGKGIAITSLNQKEIFKHIIEQLNKEIAYSEREDTKEYFIRMLNFYDGRHPWDTTREELEIIKKTLLYLLNKK